MALHPTISLYRVTVTETDLFISWAAEEFVAAGRTDRSDARHLHRDRAILFAEISRALRERSTIVCTPSPADPVGRVLAHAFAPATAKPPTPGVICFEPAVDDQAAENRATPET